MSLESLIGRVGDVDSHEQIPVPQYPEVFGERGRRFLEANEELWKRLERSFPSEEQRMDLNHRDTIEISPETVWTLKGSKAPSAADMNRRPAVMDQMGINRQLIFPTMGLFALAQSLGGGFNGVPKATPEQIQIGIEALDAYNEWAGAFTKKYPDRLRIVGMLSSSTPGLTAQNLVKKTEELIATGVKAVSIVTGQPPAGLSPAHPDLDAFYATLTEKNVALVFHPPAGAGYRKTDVWGIFPGAPGDVSFATALHQSEENFLTVMLMGGVFERHPKLRLGIIENGASWLGPLAERLDVAFDTTPTGVRRAKLITKRPSEFMAKQVRTSVLLHEPVEIWLKRYPMIQECYCYSSDFPHIEGGQWSLKNFYERISPLGNDIVEKFFVTNPQLLLQ